jgi:RNA polymerase sigma-70 factor (ECF subfamily)
MLGGPSCDRATGISRAPDSLSRAARSCIDRIVVAEAHANAASAGIVDGLRRGEAAALDRAFHLYKDRLFAFLVRLDGRRDAAEDLLQETFVALARHAPRLQPDTDLAAWLFAVARNAFRASLRRRGVAERALAAIAEDPAPSDPERAMVAGFELSRLGRELAALPAPHREVLLLVVEGDLSGEQAAAVLSISPAAFRKRLERARAELLRRLDAAPPSHTSRGAAR